MVHKKIVEGAKSSEEKEQKKQQQQQDRTVNPANICDNPGKYVICHLASEIGCFRAQRNGWESISFSLTFRKKFAN